MADKPTISIDSQGDVVLVCSEGKPVEAKLRVNSTILRLASPVFRAMLGPHFKEGNALATASASIEIMLPDDNGQTMAFICSCMHMHRDPSRAGLDYINLYKTCDKYDVVKPMAPWATFWLEDDIAKAPENVHLQVLQEMLRTAVGFGAHRVAAAVSRKMIRSSSPIGLSMCKPYDVPEKFYIQIAEERAKVISDLHDSIESAIDTLVSTPDMGDCQGSNCNAVQAGLQEFMQQLSACDLWPRRSLNRLSLQEISSRIESFDDGLVMSEISENPCRMGRSCLAYDYSRQPKLSEMLEDGAESALAMVQDMQCTLDVNGKIIGFGDPDVSENVW